MTGMGGGGGGWWCTGLFTGGDTWGKRGQWKWRRGMRKGKNLLVLEADGMTQCGSFVWAAMTRERQGSSLRACYGKSMFFKPSAQHLHVIFQHLDS